MSNRLLKTLFAASLAFSVTACGDDNGLGPTIELTETEAEEMMEVLGVLAFESMPEGGAAGVAAMVRNPEIAFATFNFNETISCPVSGSRHTTGSYNVEETSLSANFTQTYTNCAATAQETGTVWTFNTAPTLTLTFNANSNPTAGTATMTMNFNGGFNVSSNDGQSGSCVITLAWNMTIDETAQNITASVNGTVCGRQVNQSVDFTG